MFMMFIFLIVLGQKSLGEKLLLVDFHSVQGGFHHELKKSEVTIIKSDKDTVVFSFLCSLGFNNFHLLKKAP